MKLSEFKRVSKEIEIAIKAKEKLVKEKNLEQASKFRLLEINLIISLFKSLPCDSYQITAVK